MQFWYISAQKDSDIIVHFIPTSKLPLPIPKLYTIAAQKKLILTLEIGFHSNYIPSKPKRLNPSPNAPHHRPVQGHHKTVQ